MFTGYTQDTYDFFWELALQNEKSFFDANRERYKASVYGPTLALCQLLTPTINDIDTGLCTRPSLVISRIRRDTRFTRDKSPYRDHVWIGYRLGEGHLSENFVIYAQFGRDSYGYGMGMWGNNPPLMQRIRKPMLAHPERFLSLVNDKAFAERFQPDGELYKRPKYPDEPEGIGTYLNRKGLSFNFSSPELHRTMVPELGDEIKAGFLLLKPVYRFIMELN